MDPSTAASPQPAGKTLAVLRLGHLAYRWAMQLQERLVEARHRGEVGDLLLLVEHPPTVTLGRGGGYEDLLVAPERLAADGIAFASTNRGGRATYHGPGQLVVYPIVRLAPHEAHAHLWRLEEAAIQTLAQFGVVSHRDADHPGVWVGKDKIAAIGLSIRRDVAYHGIALNVAPNLRHFETIVACGIADRGTTSLARLLGTSPALEEVERVFCEAFARLSGATWHVGLREAPWLVAPAPQGPEVEWLAGLFQQERVHTVCEEAACPNVGECWGLGTATFMLLGDVCTRHCRFCAVTPGRPDPPDPLEPYRVARAAEQMELRHVVVTSVARDDLPDGGASQFTATIAALRRRLPGATIEVLIPDFAGSASALALVIQAGPDVLSHNIETVPRLYPLVQRRKNYRRALGVLAYAKRAGLTAKSGLILGLGETRGEVVDVLVDLRRVGCDLLTLGQYLQPTDRHLPVAEYVHPAEFAWYREIGLQLGFTDVASGPLVRSSYRAGDMLGSLDDRARRRSVPPKSPKSGAHAALCQPCA